MTFDIGEAPSKTRSRLNDATETAHDLLGLLLAQNGVRRPNGLLERRDESPLLDGQYLGKANLY